MVRRWSLGLALSIALHAAVVGAVVGWALVRQARPRAVEIDVMGMRVEELKDLPLGAAPSGAGAVRARAHARAPAVTEKEGTLASRDVPGAPRAGADDGEDEGGAARVTDLKQLGPEGSRFTMLLRLDRLKGTPFAVPVDALMQRMPDRHDLLDGTGLGLYEDFDALLISTPNPLDYTVTFLAARHHLSDAAVHAAIDRGARATGRVIVWRSEGRRPWGERRARGAAAPPTALATRDARIIVLPAPGLVVVTPPAYRALLLGSARRSLGADAGVSVAADAGGDAADAGIRDGGQGQPSPSWSALLRRIDAENGLLGPHDVAMVTAVDLFKRAGGGRTELLGVPLEVPRALTAVLGGDPEPFLEITGDFAEEAEARRWEATWPTLQRKLRTNPYLVLGGFGSIVGRITSTRDGSTVRLRITATTDETVRLLQMAASALGG